VVAEVPTKGNEEAQTLQKERNEKKSNNLQDNGLFPDPLKVRELRRRMIPSRWEK